MDVWRFCFRVFFIFLLYRCIIHRHTTVPFQKRVPWNSCHFFSSCWGIIKSAALGLKTELVAHALQFWFAALIGLDRSNVLKVKNIIKQVLQFLPIWQFYYSQSELWYPGKHHQCNTTVIVNYLLIYVSVLLSFFLIISCYFYSAIHSNLAMHDSSLRKLSISINSKRV